MIIRTVLDCRPNVSKFYCSVLLLAASWAECVEEDFPLEIMITGEPPATLLSFLDGLKIRWHLVEPDPGLDFVPTGNTLLGGCESGVDERIMLVDNDIFFLSSPKALRQIPDDTLAGVPSGMQRVTAAQWSFVKEQLGLEPLNQSWVSPKEDLNNLDSLGRTGVPIIQTYINGGVLLLPFKAGFIDIWRTHIIDIDNLFRGSDLKSRAVCNSNMIGLAIAAASHKKFQWLEDGYNYRHLHILLDRLDFEEISIIHMTGQPRYEKNSEEAGPSLENYVSDYVSLYWKYRINNNLAAIESKQCPDKFKRANSTSEKINTVLMNVIALYDLNAVMREIFDDLSN